ncbi:MAG: hypothetical protein ISR96_06635 [Nitrospira sp.]|nr:hypothetical protein [bacterium]MBL7049171.1 hypothetical protein [Nitrospira sp.]
MKFQKNQLSLTFLLCSILILTGCGPSVLKIDYQPLPNSDNILASIQPQKIHLLPFTDSREGDIAKTLIGGKQLGEDGVVYDVNSEKPVAEIMHDAVKAELLRSGHSVVDSDGSFTMMGTVETFWLHTDVSEEDWDVIANVAIRLELKNNSSGKSSFFGPYSIKNNELRYIAPADPVMKRIIELAISKIIRQMSSDNNIASALSIK